MRTYRFLTVFCSFLAMTLFLRAGELEIFPTAELLPTDHQGPFVALADGGILTVENRIAFRSTDGGKTWEEFPVFASDAFADSNERALIRTPEGVILFAFLNLPEMQSGKAPWGEGNAEDWILPTYITRSTDEGKTWSEPLKLQTRWCGAVRNFLILNSGRILLVGQSVVPWAHVTHVHYSDDGGLSWQVSNTLELGGNHDHDGAMEGALLLRKDGSILMLIRTTKGVFYKSESTDAGETWSKPQPTGIQNNNCCCALGRLADGRCYLLWNRNPNLSAYHFDPQADSSGLGLRGREELSIAFSDSVGETWSEPLVIAARYDKQGDDWAMNQVSYPYLFEPKPGTLWITSMFGNCRLTVSESDLLAAVPSQRTVSEKRILLLGDSTLADREGVEICASLLRDYFKANQLGGRIVNSSVPSSTTADALAAFKTRVTERNPDLVVVQFGLNDSAVDVWKNPPDTKPRISPEQFEANLREITRRCKDQHIPLILMTTNQMRWSDKTKELYGKPPYNPDDERGFNDLFLRDYNEITRRVAASENLPLVDIYARLEELLQTNPEAVNERLLPDRMHPNSAGQRLVFEMLLPEINRQVKFPPRENELKTPTL